MGGHEMHVVPRRQEILEFTAAGFALVKMLEWPWFGEEEHGFALIWVHAPATVQDLIFSSNVHLNLRGDGVHEAKPVSLELQAISSLSNGVRASALLAAISGMISCCIVC